MACGRRCAVAGPTVQRTGSRSFPIASASSVSRAVVVVRLAKRCSDTGIPLTPEFLAVNAGSSYQFGVASLSGDQTAARQGVCWLQGALIDLEVVRQVRGRLRVLDPGVRKKCQETKNDSIVGDDHGLTDDPWA